MATIDIATAEGGTNSTTITTGNSGGESGTAFSTVTIGTSGTFIFDNAHVHTGNLAYKIATSATSAVVNGKWPTFTAIGTLWLRFYLYAPIGAAFACIEVYGAASGLRLALQVGASGALSIVDASLTLRGTTTALVPSNQWVRIEAKIVASPTAPTFDLKLFNSPESTTPTETLSLTATEPTAADLQQALIGTGQSGANIAAYWMDDVVLSDFDWIGPVLDPSRRPRIIQQAVNRSYTY